MRPVWQPGDMLEAKPLRVRAALGLPLKKTSKWGRCLESNRQSGAGDRMSGFGWLGCRVAIRGEGLCGRRHGSDAGLGVETRRGFVTFQARFVFERRVAGQAVGFRDERPRPRLPGPLGDIRVRGRKEPGKVDGVADEAASIRIAQDEDGPVFVQGLAGPRDLHGRGVSGGRLRGERNR